MKKLFLFLAVTLAFVSCKAVKKTNGELKENQSLSSCNGNWTLVLFMKDGVAQTLVKSDLTILPIENGQADVSGSMGANRFMGKISYDSEGAIKSSPLASTRIGASAEVMEFERDFSEFFSGITSYSVGKESGEAFQSLVLKNDKMNAYMRFTKNSPFYATWRLLAVNSGNAVESVDSDATITIEQKSASVFTGINQANLGAEINEEKMLVHFTDGPMTSAAGSEEDMRVEHFLMQNILNADRYALSGDTFSLYSGDTLLLEFTRREPL